MRDFLPMGQVTGVGSLPHTDADEAVRFVAELSPEIPFWPQLPQRSGDEAMIAQMVAPLRDVLVERNAACFDVQAGGLPELRRRLCDGAAVLQRESAAGFFAFERALEANTFTHARALKGQMTGSITLAHCLFERGCPFAAFPELYAELVAYLCRLGRWQVERLQRFRKPVLIFIDEPAFALGTASAYLVNGVRQLIQSLRQAGAYVGIHCCASSSPSMLCALQPDILSFDAHQQLEAWLASTALRRFVDNGGWLAFGMIPTWDDLDTYSPGEAFVRWLAAANDTYHLPQLVTQSLFTATCGLGLLDIPAAKCTFLQADRLSQYVRKTLPKYIEI